MKKAKFGTKVAIDHVRKGTSIGRHPITSTMNKTKEEVINNIGDKEEHNAKF